MVRKNKIQEQVLRDILLKMSYDLSKTLNENITEQGLDGPNGNINPSDNTRLVYDIDPNADMSNVYPNYCKYPKMVINPKDIDGQSGLIDDPKTGIRYCFYPVPSTTGDGSVLGLHIPSDAPLLFWGDARHYDVAINGHMREFPNDNEEQFEDIITTILPPNTVRMINGTYGTYITRINGSGTVGWKFKGFYDKSRNVFPQPEWVDDRSGYQKFVDDWGTAIQITLVVGTVIAGIYTGGASWVLTAEILVELGVGAAVGYREFEKGNNVAAGLSLITGMLPVLKLSKAFAGLSTAAMKTLSGKLAKSGLSEASDVKSYIKFYRSLDVDEQKVLSQLLKQDEAAMGAIMKEFASTIGDDALKAVKTAASKNPKILKDLKFWDKLWARELTSNAVVGVLGITIGVLWGKELNNAEKQAIEDVYLKVPDEHKKEFIYNLAQNGDKVTEIIADVQSEIIDSKILTQDLSDNMAQIYLNTITKDSVENSGGVYVELPNDGTTALEDKIITKKRDIKQLRKDGWITKEELSNKPKNTDIIEMMKINGVYWYLIN